jgi:hypothetical protein
MAGGKNSFLELCIAGGIITSCGWLDVVLFLTTRRAVSDMVGQDAGVLATFATKPWYSKRPGPFGTTTTISTPGPGKLENLSEVHRRNVSEEGILNPEHVKSRLTIATLHKYGVNGEVELTTVQTIDIRSEAMQERDEAAMMSWVESVESKGRCPTSQDELMFAKLDEQLGHMEMTERNSAAEIEVDSGPGLVIMHR